MENSDIKYWTTNRDIERLKWESIVDAIEEWADDALADGDEMPDKIKVYGFNPMELPTPEKLADHILMWVSEYLDCDLGLCDPDGGSSDLSDSKELATSLAANVLQGYHVWVCEQVKIIEVDPRNYIKEAV